MRKDHKLVDSVPSWNSPVTPKPMYESPDAQAYWAVPVYLTIPVSKLTEWMRGLWIIRETKSGQLKWVVCGGGWRIPERKMRRRQSSTVLCHGSWRSNTQGITSTSVILSLMCYIGGCSKKLELTMKKLVGAKAKGVLQRMQKATCLVLAQFNTYFWGTCCLTV